jgi:hypothetical protein
MRASRARQGAGQHRLGCSWNRKAGLWRGGVSGRGERGFRIVPTIRQHALKQVLLVLLVPTSIELALVSRFCNPLVESSGRGARSASRLNCAAGRTRSETLCLDSWRCWRRSARSKPGLKAPSDRAGPSGALRAVMSRDRRSAYLAVGSVVLVARCCCWRRAVHVSGRCGDGASRDGPSCRREAMPSFE